VKTLESQVIQLPYSDAGDNMPPFRRVFNYNSRGTCQIVFSAHGTLNKKINLVG